MIDPVAGQVYVTINACNARQVVSVDDTHVRIRAFPHGTAVWRIKRASFQKVYREQSAREARERYWSQLR